MTRHTLADLDQIPAVCDIEDVAEWLGISRRQVDRLRAAGTFPIRELPSIGPPRWSGCRVRAYLEDRDMRTLRRLG
jgi:hypothetical protein